MWRISGLTSVGKCGLRAAEGEMKSPTSFTSESEELVETAAMENWNGKKLLGPFMSAYTAHMATVDLSSYKMD